jgi:hypothetical protein
MISKVLNILRSNNSIPTMSRRFSQNGELLYLDFDAPISVTVPAGVNLAVFGYNSGPKILVNAGIAAETMPAQGASKPSNAIENPNVLEVSNGETLWLRSANSAGDIVTISYYSNGDMK